MVAKKKSATKKKLASKQAVKDFLESCEIIREDIEQAQKMFLLRKKGGPGTRPYRSFWKRVQDHVYTIFNAELFLLNDLEAWAKYQHDQKLLSQNELDRANNIINVVDKPAQFAKVIVPSYYGREPEVVSSKAKLRNLIFLHYIVNQELKIEKILPEELFESCIEALNTSLENLSWLRQIFISYAHKDKEYLVKLVNAIKQKLDENYIFLWDDREIIGSDDWNLEINKQLEEDDLSIVLISDNFFNSDYITNTELKSLLTNRAKNGGRIYPIILEDSENLVEEKDWLISTQFRPSGPETIKKDYNSGQKEKIFYAEVAKELIILMNRLSDPDKASNLKGNYENA